jgi:hypothetical protein
LQDENERWLEILSGNITTDKKINSIDIEAELVKASMLKNIKNYPEFEISNKNLHKIITVAKEKKFLKDSGEKKINILFEKYFYFLFKPQIVIASYFLIAGLVILPYIEKDEDTIRGSKNINTINQIVNSPNKTAEEWQKKFLQEKIPFDLSYNNEDISIRIKLDKKSIDFLTKNNILITSGDWCILYIEKEK